MERSANGYVAIFGARSPSFSRCARGGTEARRQASHGSANGAAMGAVDAEACPIVPPVSGRRAPRLFLPACSAGRQAASRSIECRRAAAGKAADIVVGNRQPAGKVLPVRLTRPPGTWLSCAAALRAEPQRTAHKIGKGASSDALFEK